MSLFTPTLRVHIYIYIYMSMFQNEIMQNINIYMLIFCMIIQNGDLLERHRDLLGYKA